ncbi:unnamed protein product [Darwinula stevensoni]|uniref:RING-type domain-containing protein n=1 Tax=Darwinula stevensoni TaxID=69355 RepID=A0A7R8X0D2_9CRUS|nr:unnamed protein product [Darwinula stevensoni]CAG0879035.1 unnamed protein product [Darwinula stevensoni]
MPRVEKTRWSVGPGSPKTQIYDLRPFVSIDLVLFLNMFVYYHLGFSGGERRLADGIPSPGLSLAGERGRGVPPHSRRGLLSRLTPVGEDFLYTSTTSLLGNSDGKELLSGIQLSGGNPLGFRALEGFPCTFPSHLLPQLHPAFTVPTSTPSVPFTFSAFSPSAFAPPLSSLARGLPPPPFGRSCFKPSQTHSPQGFKEELSSPRSDPSPDVAKDLTPKSRSPRSGAGGMLDCPACGEMVSTADLPTHLAHELERLMDTPFSRKSPSRHFDDDSRWETYHRVRSNRQQRLRLKNRRGRSNEDFPLPNGSLIHKVEEGQETMKDDPYITRHGFLRSTKGEEDEGDVVVDGDDTSIFGPPQYSDADVIRAQELHREGEEGGGGISEKEQTRSSTESPTDGFNSQQLDKCFICKNPYLKPLVSISCWHVHCETCWLRSLGSEKLCPQCKNITRPTELRRIYL